MHTVITNVINIHIFSSSMYFSDFDTSPRKSLDLSAESKNSTPKNQNSNKSSPFKHSVNGMFSFYIRKTRALSVFVNPLTNIVSIAQRALYILFTHYKMVVLLIIHMSYRCA